MNPPYQLRRKAKQWLVLDASEEPVAAGTSKRTMATMVDLLNEAWDMGMFLEKEMEL